MKEALTTAIAQAVSDLFAVEQLVELTRPDPQFGDYSTNVALQLAKTIGQPPRAIAESLAAKLRDALQAHIAEVTIAGPGFINLRVTDEVLYQQAEQGITSAQTQKVVIETNNPNPFKAMHIGHAFNAIIGDTLANLLEAGGNEVHRVSYHGDVGSHVGKSMWALLKFVDGDPSKLQTVVPQDRNRFMSEMYAAGAKAYTEDEAIKEEINRLAEASFTLDDPVYKTVYETCKAWSFELLDATIARLGCKPGERKYLESEADAMGVATVKQHVGSVFSESDGAIIFEGEKYGGFTNVFVSSRGRGLYAARDLGLMQLKQREFNPQKSYIVTAEEQRDYFKGVIKAAELCMPELNGVTVNLSTGTVKLSTGKMSSRKGEVLDIAWLFEQVEQAVRARGAEPDADTLIGALRYEFLRVKLGGDVVFDVNEAVSVTGNSGPYLQYAHARARSILRKSSAAPTDTSDEPLQPDERALLRKLSEFAEVTDRAIAELAPHSICTFLYELAQEFNRFYEHNRVIDDPRQALRLSLVQRYADRLRDGLQLLGITAPEQM